jgi:TonB-dependent starch-binding outer membrane protein SusC
MFMLTAVAWTQGRNVTGRVTSAEDGLGIPGASVVLKGTSVGTVTDFDGMYSISVPSAESVLVYSFVGMEHRKSLPATSLLSMSVSSRLFSISMR